MSSRSKTLGRMKHILPMEVHYVRGEVLCISQTVYIDRALERVGMSDAKPVGSSMLQNEKLPPMEKDEGKINHPNIPFRELIDALQYLLACTRPDLANAVRSLARYSGAYTHENYMCAKRVLRYLRATRTYSLVYRHKSNLLQQRVDAYCDVDHTNCPDTSRSNTGYLLRLTDACSCTRGSSRAK